MDRLEPCPICGKSATLIHMNDTYDRADFGWEAGCGAAREGDGVHLNMNQVRIMAMPSKEAAVIAWNIKARKVRAQADMREAKT